MRDIGRKSPFKPTPTSIWLSRKEVTLLEFRRYCWRQKTRVPVHVLSYGVVCVILSLAVLVQNRRVTDRQIDGRTHDDSIYRARILSRCKNRFVAPHFEF